ncbi:MAG: hypothetical protein A3G20_00095 [Acidobacteria bacterium RIFCSPLOWO2_12_FULL_59_11]|nr:MAG: hypothetical protein A3G20_00095 [Acidobacteria bacterium RIFCSPLOWO2_12_FULL_59_11]
MELYHSRAITDEDYALCIWRDTVTPDSSPTLDSGYIAAAAEANKRLRRRPTEQVILATIRELQDSNLGPTDYERVPGSNSRQSKPTNAQRSLAHTETAFGQSCSLSAGDFGEFSESPPENPSRKGTIKKLVMRCEKVKGAKNEGQYKSAGIHVLRFVAGR